MFQFPDTGPLPEIEIEGDRIVLRAHTPNDLGLVEAASADDFIPKITSVPARWSVDEGQAYLARQADRLVTRTGWPLAIHDRELGHSVGQIGIWIESLRHGRAEIGYWMLPEHRKSGYMSEAVKMVVEWAFTHLPVHRLCAFIEPWNIGSIKTVEAAGFESEGLLRLWQFTAGEPKDMLSFARFADQ